MQFRDKTAYVWGLRYRWDPSLSRNPVPRFRHFMPPCLGVLVGWVVVIDHLAFRVIDHPSHLVHPSIHRLSVFVQINLSHFLIPVTICSRTLIDDDLLEIVSHNHTKFLGSCWREILEMGNIKTRWFFNETEFLYFTKKNYIFVRLKLLRYLNNRIYFLVINASTQDRFG